MIFRPCLSQQGELFRRKMGPPLAHCESLPVLLDRRGQFCCELLLSAAPIGKPAKHL
jgi:hypothetical protein